MKPLKKLNIGFSENEKCNSIDTTSTSMPALRRIVQNFRLIWLDSGINQVNNNDSINSLKK
jgi:hypothetical protein